MPRDATPDEITLVNDNFSNANHAEIAKMLQDEWGASTTFRELGEKYEPHRTTIQEVYRRYFGVPESLFHDGIEDERTIAELKDEYGSLNNYINAREMGHIDQREVRSPGGDDVEGLEDALPHESLTEREFELIREMYTQGWKDAIDYCKDDRQPREAATR